MEGTIRVHSGVAEGTYLQAGIVWLPGCNTRHVPQRSGLDDIAAPTTPFDANILHHCKKHMSHHIPVVPTNTTSDIRSRRGSCRIDRGVCTCGFERGGCRMLYKRGNRNLLSRYRGIHSSHL